MSLPTPINFRQHEHEMREQIENRLFGFNVIENDSLQPPHVQTTKELAIATVRHQMLDILEWLGEKPGPKPGALIYDIVVLTPTRTILAHSRLVDLIRNELARDPNQGGPWTSVLFEEARAAREKSLDEERMSGWRHF